jgi:rare lipoprotein A
VGTLILTGCSGGAQTEPAWPEQPSPSYPQPSSSKQSDPAVETIDEPAPPAAPTKSSSLAKEYDGKQALSTFKGKATYYADSLAGNHTASGDIYDPNEFTAAHRKLPFGTVVRVIRQDTGEATYVRINDRGPFGPSDRIIDLSKAAAQEIDMMKAGVVTVRVEVLEKP